MNRAIRMLALSGSAAAMLAATPATAGARSTLSPASLDFGKVPVGATSPPQGLTLTAHCTTILAGAPPLCLSVGTDTINVSLGTTGDFAATTTCPSGLGPDLVGAAPQSCPISVTFSPSGAGAQAGTLSTGTIGPAGLVPAPTAQLRGTGTAPAAGSSSPGKKTRAKCRRHKNKQHSYAAKRCKKKRR